MSPPSVPCSSACIPRSSACSVANSACKFSSGCRDGVTALASARGGGGGVAGTAFDSNGGGSDGGVSRRGREVLVSNPSDFASDFAGLAAAGSCFSFFDLRTAAAAARIAAHQATNTRRVSVSFWGTWPRLHHLTTRVPTPLITSAKLWIRRRLIARRRLSNLRAAEGGVRAASAGTPGCSRALDKRRPLAAAGAPPRAT